MELEEYLSFKGVGTQENLAYLPLPNTADVVLTDREAPWSIIPTAFCFPFLRNGDVVLTNNRRRGSEIPGGHRDVIIDTLEAPEDAATREAFEETGASISGIQPIGFMRSFCQGDQPEGYQYPFPYSCQQFYAGLCVRLDPYVENDECLAPLIVPRSDIELHLKGCGLILYKHALESIFG